MDTSSTTKTGGSLPIPKAKRGIRSYFKDVQREMKHVSWPTRQETTRLTGVVLGVCFMVTVLLTVLSTGIDFVLATILRGGK